MAGKNNSVRLLLLGLSSLWAGTALTGCAFTSHSSSGSSFTTSGAPRTASVKDSRARETFQKTYAAVKVNTLRVRDEMGAIEIRPIEDGKDEIRIEATKSVEGVRLSEADLKKLLSKVQITAHLDGDTLVIEAEHETEGFPENADATVGFVIAVPTRVALDLRTDNSPITAPGSDEDQPARRLVLNGRAAIIARTSNGGITLKTR
jgi:hypothetical protein